ncbi:MAG: IPT/TIG domain-containing protein [Acidobacteriota bacterium]
MKCICVLASILLCFAPGAFAQPEVAAVTNAANYTPTVAPGSLATIFGTGLAPSTASAPSTPLPVGLNSVTVSVNGRSAPLVFVSATQINFQVPYETTAGVATLRVTNGGSQSNAYQMVVAAFAPGIFQGAAGHGIIQNQDYSINTSGNPAAGGSYVVVYFTGLGVTSVPITSGAVSPTSPLASFTGTSKATIGDADAPVLFTGMTPGFVGLAQANIQVPELPSGDYPLVLSLNGNQFVSALISVSGSGAGFQVTSLLRQVSGFSLPGVASTVVPGISGIVANSLAFYNNVLYVCSASDIKVVDVANPAAPKFLMNITDSAVANSAHNCTVNPAATKPFLTNLVRASQAVAIYDLTVPSAPVKRSHSTIGVVPRSVAYSGNAGFFGEDIFSYTGHDVTLTRGNILSVDFTNLVSPAAGPVVKADPGHPETNTTNLRPYMYMAGPNLLYVASTTASLNFDTGAGALDIFDTSAPRNILGAGQIMVPGTKMLLTLAVQGSEMLAVGNTRGFSPGNVFSGGEIDFPFAGYLTLTMFDISDITKPKIQGNLIVPSMQPGNIGGPISLGSVPLGGGFYAVTCAAPDLNASGQGPNGSLVIVDARDPQRPQAYTYATLSGLGGLTVANGYLYAAVGSGANVYRIQLPQSLGK